MIGTIPPMRLLRRPRYEDVIHRQLELFADEHRELLSRVADAERDYRRASAEDAEERYGDYMDLVEEAEDDLLALRDRFAETMEARERRRYEREFTRAAERMLPTLAGRHAYMRAIDPDSTT